MLCKLTMFALVGMVALYTFTLGKCIAQSVHNNPTYRQVCAPLVFIRKADYYNDRTFVVCGSPTTNPVLKEYPNQ